MSHFSGSYAPSDVHFLLKPLELEPIHDIEYKERLIQTGKKHYSEMISVEQQPDDAYMELFYRSVEINLTRMADDLYRITRKIREARSSKEIAVVSLARAGTPIGVGIKRLLESEFATPSSHYSISIIRDRGIDEQALHYIVEKHAPESIVIVDGWTGKGAIASEFHDSMARLQHSQLKRIPRELFVLCDLGGVSTNCGSTEDYLIPSAILNATISGLVSRTILNEMIGPTDFHGCVFYEDLRARDLSGWFVDRLLAEVASRLPALRVGKVSEFNANQARKRMSLWLDQLMSEFGVRNLNLIKPGVCEATRALLRRSANRLLIKDRSDINSLHLVHLAEKNQVPIEIRDEMPFMATVLIRSLSHG